MKRKNVQENIVMILCRDLKVPGGVTNFFRIFFKKYPYEDIKIESFKQGIAADQSAKMAIPYILKTKFDIIKFSFLLLRRPSIKIVHLNPSFYPVPILRDSFFLIISKALGRKVLVFYHGWDDAFNKTISMSRIRKRLFRSIYSKADSSYVLARDFKNELSKLGIQRIEVTKTFFDGDLFRRGVKKKNRIPHFLYVGRMQEEKGILTILEALNSLKRNGLDFEMEFIGWFVDDYIKREFYERIESFHLKDRVRFLGYCPDDKKIQKIIENDIFLYPSYYPEGCPTVIIEAMAGGCFVISTDVAALKEVIVDGENGYLVKPKDPYGLYLKMKDTITNYDHIYNKMLKNEMYAHLRYESMIIIDQIYRTYKTLLGKGCQ